MSFQKALPVILKAEGGYVNDPADRGGATNKGITQKTYDAWRASMRQAVRPVKEITDAEVALIYEKRYWLEGRCEALVWPVSLIHFDACVNHGPGRASRMLQEAAGVQVDGKVGPKTLAAANANPLAVGKAYIEERAAFYKLLAMSASQAKFLKGWLKRLEHLEAVAVTGWKAA